MLFWPKGALAAALSAPGRGIAKRLFLCSCLAIIIAAGVSCTQSGDAPGSRTGPDLAPPFELTDIEGRRVALADFRGKIVILEFFATWCEPCKYTAQALQNIYTLNWYKGVAVIGISIDEGGGAEAKLKSYIRTHKLSYPVAIDSGHSIKKMYNAYVLPTTVIIDRRGRIVKKQLGISRNYSKWIAEEISWLKKRDGGEKVITRPES
jgi:peroxiredoxin